MKFKVLPLLAITTLLAQFTSCAQKTPPTTVVSSRTPTSEKVDTPWTTWYHKGTVGGLLVLKGIREDLLENNLQDAHVDYSGYKAIDCSKTNTKFRSADGTCTDPTNPNVGAAGTAFSRNVPPEFIDHNAADKMMTPNPSKVSQVLFTREGAMKEVPFLNMLAASWIQFMVHDWLTHGPNAEKNPMHVEHGGPASTSVDRTKENTSDSKMYKPAFGKTTLNDNTHWWDGSQIYGSNQAEQNEVRSFSNGKMSTVMINGREVLPKNSSLNIQMNRQNVGYEVTGFRENWWMGLSMLHHLFVKEHNSIADMLMKKYVTKEDASGKWIWKNGKERLVLDNKGLDEQIFGTARLINSAVMAKIHTIEWTPAILNNDVLKKAMYTNWYGLAHPQTWSKLIKHIPGFNKVALIKGINTGYTLGGIVGQNRNDYGVPFSISEEFASVYRLHSLLPENINLKKYSDKKMVEVPFSQMRNEKSYDFFTNYDLKDLFYSFGTQLPGQLVLNNFPKFMQELKIPGHGIMDLGMVDIIRDRERGVPRYNQFRRGISLKPITSYADFFPAGKPLDQRQKDIIKKLNAVYGKDDSGSDNVEAIDLLVGTLAEEVRPTNFGFGETMFHIFILMASRRLMADRFFTDDYNNKFYTKGGMGWIDDEGYMHKVIGRHMPELKPHMKGLETAFMPWKD